MAGLHEPVGRQELRRHRAGSRGGDREPGAAEQRQQGDPPPIAGPIESGVSTCPSRIPSAANGISPTRIRPVILSHSLAGRLTPSDAPARYSAHQAEQRHHVAGQHLRAKVRARRQRRDPQLAVPADRALGGDARAAGEHRAHRPERRQADHVVERRGDARPGEVLHVALRRRDHEVQDQRKRQREEEEAAVAQRAQQLVAGVDERVHRPPVRRPGAGSPAAAPSPVSARNACSSPAPRSRCRAPPGIRRAAP